MRSEAVSGQELAEMSHKPGLLRSGYASVDSRDDTLGDASHNTSMVELEDNSAPSQAKLRYLMRRFRFQFASSTFSRCMGSRWNGNTEPRKVAIHHNRAIATAHGLLHLVPLSCAILLLVFHWTNYWVDAKNDYSTELQFAAKFHELLMQASIADVLLGLIRAGLINGLVPFGTLSGAMQPTQLSYLWSLDFFSLFQSRAFQGWRKTLFVVAMPLLFALTALVGPSSAVLMIPRAGVSRTRSIYPLWGRASDEASYPSQIPITSIDSDLQELNLTLWYSEEHEYGASDLSNSYGSNTIPYISQSSRNVRRLLRWSEHDPRLPKTGDDLLLEANVTIPTDVVLGQLLPRGSMENKTEIVVAPHPLVRALCWGSRYDIKNSSDWYHPWPWTSLMPGLPTLISKASESVEVSGSALYFSPVWISSTEPVDHPLLVVFFGGWSWEPWNQSALDKPDLLSSIIESNDPDVTAFATACSVSAYWDFEEVQTRYIEGSALVSPGEPSKMELFAHRKITLDIAGDHPMKSAKFSSILEEIGLYGRIGSSRIDVALSAALAIWIAKVPSLVSVETSNILEDPFFTDEPPDKNIEDYTPYEFTTKEYGYGYGMRSTSVYLSMTVMLLYCIVAIGYMLYTFATGLASTAWTSGSELLALALQSKRPDFLGHIGVGIDSAKTLGEGVGIRVNADNGVELVFAHDRDFNTRGLQKVRQNTEY